MSTLLTFKYTTRFRNRSGDYWRYVWREARAILICPCNIRSIVRGLLLLSLVQFGSCCFKCNEVTRRNFKRSSFSASLFARSCNLKIRLAAAQFADIEFLSPEISAFFSLRAPADTLSSDRIVLTFPTISLICSRYLSRTVRKYLIAERSIHHLPTKFLL